MARIKVTTTALAKFVGDSERNGVKGSAVPNLIPFTTTHAEFCKAFQGLLTGLIKGMNISNSIYREPDWGADGFKIKQRGGEALKRERAQNQRVSGVPSKHNRVLEHN